MTVYFIGAGPGAADLLTVRADRLIRSCSVCLYAGSIVPPEVLGSAPEGARLVNTARMPLDDIMAVIRDADAAGHDVARLQSGDPSVWSALAEQARRLAAEGIDYEIVPGVPSFAAAAAALGHELTVPEVGQSVVLTRISGRASAMPAGETLDAFGATGATLCIHLAAHDIDRVTAELEPRYGADCPAAVGTVSDIARKVTDAGVTRTAVIIVGRVLGAEGFPDSYLYSDDRPRDEHGRTIPCMR